MIEYKKLMEMIENPKKLKDFENNSFDELFIIPQNRLHDSGYCIMHIYGHKKDDNDSLYYLSSFSDVIHFENVCDHSWFCSIDIPYFGILRIFPRRNYKLIVPFTNCSDFTIYFRGEKND